jgi:hypothetical protein
MATIELRHLGSLTARRKPIDTTSADGADASCVRASGTFELLQEALQCLRSLKARLRFSV